MTSIFAKGILPTTGCRYLTVEETDSSFPDELRGGHIEPGTPRENGHIESFNGKPGDEFLNGENFDTILELTAMTE